MQVEVVARAPGHELEFWSGLWSYVCIEKPTLVNTSDEAVCRAFGSASASACSSSLRAGRLLRMVARLGSPLTCRQKALCASIMLVKDLQQKSFYS